ncbi:MAG: hypothetical protein ACYSUV_01965 [Planctomycetota bacterium]|jgi:hypothetical protein
MLDPLKIKPSALDQQVILELGFADSDDFETQSIALNPVEQRIMFSNYLELFQNMQRDLQGEPAQPLKSDRQWEQDYVRKPPTLREFIEDPYWLGSTLLPSEDSEGLFPTWREFLLRDFDIFSMVHNLVITGSLGIGKTYVMVTVLLYRLVLCSLLKNPAAFFGLSKGSKIVYNVLSVTKTQVKETAFGDALNFMARSQYFLEDCNYDPDSKYSNYRVELPGDINFTAGSKGWHVLGRNVLGVALDEGNWRNEADPDTKAYDLYNEVRIRIQNRFMRSSKFLPAISILSSSARDESSFTEVVIKEIEDANDPKHQLVYRNAVYKIKRHKLKLSGKYFKVAYGLKTQEPYILTGDYTESGKQLTGEAHEPTPAGASTELVPVEYLNEFRRRTRTALQSIAGISTGGSNRFFPTTIDMERCIELGEKDGVTDPTRPGTKFLAISMEDNLNVWDYLDHRKFLTKIASQIKPKRHPEMARFVHLDLATQSMAGLAICHLVGHKLIEGVQNATGEPFNEYRLIVEYDFILTIVAGRIKPISLEKIQNFIFWLRNKCGYRFAMVTADQFQSAMPLQMLEARNIPVGNLSVDKDDKVYTAWRQSAEELRLRLYRQDQMMQETESLVKVIKGAAKKMKVDHPKDGSKDTSDAAAGAYFNAINSEEKLSIAVDNNPAIMGNSSLDPADPAGVAPVALNLPLGYDKIRTVS